MSAVQPTIQPDVEDELRWYRMQSFGEWFAVLACCRSCATRKLHGWRETGSSPDLPDWILRA